uniref:FABP domain-containing protein n=1 Tax=Macrostomum lignano TaxID=282301 RepID=A0A1I8IW94_9PLAT
MRLVVGRPAAAAAAAAAAPQLPDSLLASGAAASAGQSGLGSMSTCHLRMKNFGQRLVRVAGAPVERPGQIVAGAQRQDGHGRAGADAKPVDGGQHPARCAVTAADEDAEPGHPAEQIEGKGWLVLRQVKHLARIEQPEKFVHQFGAEIAAGARIDEHQDRADMRRGRHRLDDECRMGGWWREQVKKSKDMSAGGFAGKWKLVDSENFDEYMKALGVGLVMRTAGSTAKPVQEISEAGGRWTIKTTSTFKSAEISFALGEEFEETTADGRKVKSTVRLEGNKLIQEQKGDPNSTIIRELGSDGKSFVMTLEAKGVVCKRKYQKDDRTHSPDPIQHSRTHSPDPIQHNRTLHSPDPIQHSRLTLRTLSSTTDSALSGPHQHSRTHSPDPIQHSQTHSPDPIQHSRTHSHDPIQHSRTHSPDPIQHSRTHSPDPIQHNRTLTLRTPSSTAGLTLRTLSSTAGLTLRTLSSTAGLTLGPIQHSRTLHSPDPSSTAGLTLRTLSSTADTLRTLSSTAGLTLRTLSSTAGLTLTLSSTAGLTLRTLSSTAGLTLGPRHSTAGLTLRTHPANSLSGPGALSGPHPAQPDSLSGPLPRRSPAGRFRRHPPPPGGDRTRPHRWKRRALSWQRCNCLPTAEPLQQWNLKRNRDTVCRVLHRPPPAGLIQGAGSAAHLTTEKLPDAAGGAAVAPASRDTRCVSSAASSEERNSESEDVLEPQETLAASSSSKDRPRFLTRADGSARRVKMPLPPLLLALPLWPPPPPSAESQPQRLWLLLKLQAGASEELDGRGSSTQVTS